jgi:hypothetical protein
MIWKETLSCGLGDWGDLDGVAGLLEAPDQTAGLLAAGAAVVMIGTEIRVQGAVCEHMPDHPPQGLAALIPRRRSSACATARALPAARLNLQGPPTAQGAGFRRDREDDLDHPIACIGSLERP